MILPKQRDSRFITIRLGGTHLDADHYLLARWEAERAERVLPLFEKQQPNGDRPRQAIELAHATGRAIPPVVGNANGCTCDSRKRSANLCWMTNDCETIFWLVFDC